VLGSSVCQVVLRDAWHRQRERHGQKHERENKSLVRGLLRLVLLVLFVFSSTRPERRTRTGPSPTDWRSAC